jgi:sorbitol-specific phosphotransferase system component IIBC
MALTTGGVLVVLLAALGALPSTSRGVLVAALLCAVPAAACFTAPTLVTGAVPAAVIGLALYAVVIGAWRPAGLRAAWVYVRGLQ